MGSFNLEKEAFLRDDVLIRCTKRVGSSAGAGRRGGETRVRRGNNQPCRKCYLSNMNDEREVS